MPTVQPLGPEPGPVRPAELPTARTVDREIVVRSTTYELRY